MAAKRIRSPAKLYFDWLVGIISPGFDAAEYSLALDKLFKTDFVWILHNDDNRYEDGLDMRIRFVEETGVDLISWSRDRCCTVLEMMVALAYRCEYDIMHDEDYGDRTPLWFWGMFETLGLMKYPDECFDERKVDDILKKFVQRRYQKSGKGGLFRSRSGENDMRKTEIWYQMCYFLEETFDF